MAGTQQNHLYVFKYYILFNNTFKMNKDNSLTKYLTFNEFWRRESVFIFAAVLTMDATDAFLLDDGSFFWWGGISGQRLSLQIEPS